MLLEDVRQGKYYVSLDKDSHQSLLKTSPVDTSIKVTSPNIDYTTRPTHSLCQHLFVFHLLIVWPKIIIG